MPSTPNNNLVYIFMPFDNGKSGISRYMLNTLENLSTQITIDLIILKKDIPFTQHLKNINYIKVPNVFANTLLNISFHTLLLPCWLWLKKKKYIFLPAINRRFFLFNTGRTLGIIHDLSQFHISKKYDLFRMMYIKYIIPRFIKHIKKIQCVSKNTYKDVIKIYKLPSRNLSINPNGFSAPKDTHSTAPISLDITFPKKFILYVSRIEHPGKNHKRLIEAFEQLDTVKFKTFHLVLIGSDWNGAEVIYQQVNNSNKKKSIHLLGFQPDAVLKEAYKRSSLLVVPSLYEGFGLPILEGFHYKVPVICSNNSSLPEIGGEAVKTFNPNNARDITNSIENVLSSKSLIKHMIQKGTEQLKLFSWEKHSKQILKELGLNRSSANEP